MADSEGNAKAEKLAAARKRVEQMKKKQKKAGAKKEEKLEHPPEASEDTKEDEASDSKHGEAIPVPDFNGSSHQRQPSASVQSKMRSSSFRQSSGGPPPVAPGFPEGDTAPEIYRKQAIRIEELERENKRLVKEATDVEKRWKRAEEELEELREAEDDTTTKSGNPSTIEGSSDELAKLKSEIVALQRQNTQLQTQAARTTRHGSSPSMSTIPPADLQASLASKSSTIESMEIEISNLRAHIERLTSGSSEKEQVAALEEKLERSERSAATAQRELSDLKKNLEHTTASAVKEGSERISAETKLRTLAREAEEAKSQNEELRKKVDALEKKVAALTTLHKEHDTRSQAQKRDREKAEKESSDLRSRLAGFENENLRLREERERLRKRDAQGVDDEGVDELENEERQRLEKKVRDLEGEVHELRRGVWRERRGDIEGEESSGLGSPNARFMDVDLGSLSPSRRRSGGGPAKGLGDFITSGINAITGAATNVNAPDSALLEDDELMDFDEEAFRVAQEEEARKRIERIKEVKRGLKSWEGWRLDLVESRRGGGEGLGEIFEI